MISQWKRALVACAFAVLAPLTIAQKISVPGGGLAAGATISGSYDNPGKAGGVVDITIGNNMPAPFYAEVIIPVKLDAAGRGSFKWIVIATWEMASFSGGGAIEVTRLIN